MSEPVVVTRQATFNTEPSDSVVSGGSIRRGSVELPVVDSSSKIAIKTKRNTTTTTTITDKNNNDSGFVNNNNNNNNDYNFNNNGDFHTIHDDNEETDIESEFDNGNNKQQQQQQQQQHKHSHSQPPSNRSSPIYGSKSAYEKFNKKHRAIKQRQRTPSLTEDFSDLDILSDVGIAADDSDCDVVPVVTPLSLSAKRKTRKEPRIKIPSSKVDNTEPTIHEETTQDILNIFTPEHSSGVIPLKSKDRTRSQTIIFQKRLETVEDEAVIIVENEENNLAQTPTNNKVNTNKSSTIKPTKKSLATDADDHGNAIKVIHDDHDKTTLAVIKDDLESSFCESDWQPKKSDSSDDKNVLTSTTVTARDNVDKEVSSAIKHDLPFIRQGVESDKEPLTARESKLKAIDSQILSKRPQSAGDKPTPKPKINQVISRHPRPISSKKLQLDVDPAETSRPPTRSAAPTPIISNFLEESSPPPETAVEESLNLSPKKATTVYSGVPRRSDTNTRDTLPNDTNNNASQKQFLAPPKASISENMETSDGYDYESETFEDILQERNAMVRAERTYQKRIKQLEEELKGMINQCQALSDENKELRKVIDGYKKAEKEREKEKDEENPESKPEPGESTIELTARIAKLESEKENLAKLNEKISLSMKADSNKAKQSEAVFVENTKLKNKNSEQEKRIQLLNHDVEDLNSQLSEATNASKAGNTAVLEFKNKELEVSVDELKYENRGLLSKIKSLESDKHLITNSLEEKRIELNEMMRAMQNETVTEVELKQSKEKLESAQEEINSVRNDLEEMKRMLLESQNKREKLQNGLSQRDNEIRRLKSEQENKEKIVSDLRSTNERLRGEITRHEENRQVYKGMEHETSALKSRIASLKIEIESSLAENQRLKYEREDASKEIDKLRNENAATTDAVHESRKYFRKWENERESRNKAEVELAKTQDEVGGLNASLKECGMKINVLFGRVRAAEEEKERFRGPNGQELETNNKILRDENKKLRQMLIERNIELANKTNEKEVLDNRVGIIEKKQKDAEFRVRQLSGWVDSINSNDPKHQESHNKMHNKKQQPPSNTSQHLPPRPTLSNVSKGHSQTSSQPFHSNNHNHNNNSSQPPPPHKRTGVKEPIIAVISPTRARKKRSGATAAAAASRGTLTPPPSWDDKHGRDEGHNHTPLSLPLIHESNNNNNNKPLTPNYDANGSYFHMYKERMKKVRDRHAFE